MEFIAFTKAAASTDAGYLGFAQKSPVERFVLVVGASGDDDPPSQIVLNRAEAASLSKQISQALKEKP